MTEPDVIVITPRQPSVIVVGQGEPAPSASGVITVDGSRVGPAGPALPIVFSKQGPVLVQPGKMTYRFPYAARIVGYSAAVGVPPVGGDIVADLKVNGVTVAALTVPGGDDEAPETVVSIPVLSGDRLTLDITATGASITPGSDLSVFIRYEV